MVQRGCVGKGRTWWEHQTPPILKAGVGATWQGTGHPTKIRKHFSWNDTRVTRMQFLKCPWFYWHGSFHRSSTWYTRVWVSQCAWKGWREGDFGHRHPPKDSEDPKLGGGELSTDNSPPGKDNTGNSPPPPQNTQDCAVTTLPIFSSWTFRKQN